MEGGVEEETQLSKEVEEEMGVATQATDTPTASGGSPATNTQEQSHDMSTATNDEFVYLGLGANSSSISKEVCLHLNLLLTTQIIKCTCFNVSVM